MPWRILIVDDEEDVRLIIRTALEPKYEVIEAHDGLDALEKLERTEPDFVLLDVMMPVMNGFEACGAIRKNPKYRNLPVMFLSALGSKTEIKKGYAEGANLYLTKPFDPVRLVRNIDMFFEDKEPQDRQRRYSVGELRDAEKQGIEPEAPGGAITFGKPSSAGTKLPPPPSRPPAGGAPSRESVSRQSTQLPREDAGHLPRVMVVDDDQQIIDMMDMSLDGVAEVTWANDGLDAIEKLVKYQPDILILDIMLPKMNGYQLCQSLRQNRAFARIPIIICSAKSSERDKMTAKRLGANDYLPKPFSPADLMAKVREVQKIPGFRIRPKTFAIEQIRDIEVAAVDTDVFKADEDSRKGHSPADREQRTQKEMAQFLAQEGKKDAFDRENPPGAPPEAKKKRRFFGFGSKE